MTGAGPGIAIFEVTAPDADWAYTATITMQVNGTEVTDSYSAVLKEGQRDLRTVEVPEGATNVQVRIEWNDGLVEFGDPLLVRALNGAFNNEGYLTHPVFFAGWVGIFVTALNLLPAGQLDGGHVARAVLGERVRFAGLLTLGALMIMAFQFSMWFVLALFLVLTGVYHPPPLNDRTPLDGKRIALAVITLAILLVSFVPVPLIY